MKKIKLFYIIIFLLPFLALKTVAKAHAQQIPEAQVYFTTLSDLRAHPPQATEVDNIMGLVTATDGNGGSYYWNATSTATDDGFITVAANGISVGRYLRIPNQNTLKFNVTVAPSLGQLSYNINYSSGGSNVTLPVVPIGIQVQPTSANGAVLNYYTNATTTGFTLNFLNVPLSGASFFITVFKQ